MAEMKKIVGLITILLSLSFFTIAFAETITLKSGRKIEGTTWSDRFIDTTDFKIKEEDYIYVDVNETREQVYKTDIEKIEKAPKKPKGIALLAKDKNWGEEKYGYRTQLIPVSKAYVIGQPMNFHLVMKNVSPDIKWYDDMSVAYTCLTIKDANGNDAHYKLGSLQTGLGLCPSIGSGEIVTLFENEDIGNGYVIVKPGKYTIQFSGISGEGAYMALPASNIIEFEVKAGAPRRPDFLIDSLSKIFPYDKWGLFDGWGGIPFGRATVKESPEIEIRAPFHSGLKDEDTASVLLWETEEPSEISAQKKEGVNKVSEYLGQSSTKRYYYAYIPSKMEEYWPTIREDIIKALNLKK